ncbi:MAG: hypothetical protein ACRCZP_19770 [Phycicoccus sp.]
MITSDHAPTIVGELDSEATPVEPQPRHRDGSMPLEETPNWYASTWRIPDAPRPNRVPVEGQEILR